MGESVNMTVAVALAVVARSKRMEVVEETGVRKLNIAAVEVMVVVGVMAAIVVIVVAMITVAVEEVKVGAEEVVVVVVVIEKTLTMKMKNPSKTMITRRRLKTMKRNNQMKKKR